MRYGPRIAALGFYLWRGQFVSRDRACAALGEMFGCAPAPSAVSAMAKKIAGIVSPALEAIIEALTASHVAHFDETGFRVAGNWPGCTQPHRASTCWSPCTPSGRSLDPRGSLIGRTVPASRYPAHSQRCKIRQIYPVTPGRSFGRAGTRTRPGQRAHFCPGPASAHPGGRTGMNVNYVTSSAPPEKTSQHNR